jgi:uncharacterized damage-inducible protein DinB
MRPTERLLDQLNRAYGGEAWHGPALRNLLDGISESHARQRPIRSGHSVIELIAHIGNWMDAVARRLGGNVVKSSTVEDWPDVSNVPWPQALEQLDRAQSRLCDAVARLSADDLEKPVPGEKYSMHGEILGVLQHTVYHAGQIGILKKALGGRE